MQQASKLVDAEYFLSEMLREDHGSLVPALYPMDGLYSCPGSARELP
jgi:hypothetical protein